MKPTNQNETFNIKQESSEIKTKSTETETESPVIKQESPVIKQESSEIKQESSEQKSDELIQSDNASQIDRVEFIRFLLSLTERLEKDKLELVSMTLCYELMRPTGLCNLINAAIDLDESSQKVTTLNQRFMKLSLIVAGLPKLCCSLEKFYESICDQLIRILLNTTSEHRQENQLNKLINSLIVTICTALYRRSRRLFFKNFLYIIYNCYFEDRSTEKAKDKNSTVIGDQKVNEINESKSNKQANNSNEFIENFSNELEQDFLSKIKNKCKQSTNDKSINEKIKVINESSDGLTDDEARKNSVSDKLDNPRDRIMKLKIDESIKISLLLLMNHFERKEIVRYFKQYFYMACVLDNDRGCSLAQNLYKLLNELLINVKNSTYLLDKTLFEDIDEFDKYEVMLDIERGVKTVILKLSNSIDKLECDGVELKKIDQITQCTMKLIDALSDAYKIDTFLLLLQRYSHQRSIDPDYSLLLCSLIDTLMRTIITPEGLIMLINFPEKAIDFVNLTLERLTLNYDTNIYELSTSTQNKENEDEDEELKNSIKEDSLNMCLQIIDFVLKKQLLRDLFEKLKKTLDRFVVVCSKGNINEEVKRKAIELQNELKSKSYISIGEYEENKEFKQAILDLNSNLMPDRAHALITLKKLIYSKNPNIQTNKTQLITLLKECLQDDESYIYLSAINTLAELALNHTDEVLPILIESFNDNQRKQMDRLKVGQVIVYLSKQLNEMAHCYAKPIMNMLLISSKDECDLIRVSALSNLAEFCSVLKFKLNFYITEIMICIEFTLKSDPSIEVKRACVMFFHLLLNNLDQKSLYAIESELRNIYSLLKNVYNTTLDDLIQLHAQLALEQLDRIAREILKSMNTLPIYSNRLT